MSADAMAIRDKLCLECVCTFAKGCGCIEAIETALAAERERCARVAETEPEPDGPMPVEFNRERISDIVKGTVRATRQCIAERIRQAHQ